MQLLWHRVEQSVVENRDNLWTIEVFPNCKDGTCTCSHYINGNSTQLKRFRFVFFTQGEGNVFKDGPSVSKFLWEGVVQGFKIVDEDCKTSYTCRNYFVSFWGKSIARKCLNCLKRFCQVR